MRSKAIVDAKAFAEALAQVSKTAKRVSAPLPPVLSEVQVRFSNGRCILTATDLETWLIKEIPANGDDFAFIFRRTKDIVKACRFFAEELIIEAGDPAERNKRTLELSLTCGGRCCEFDALTAEDYPDYEPFEAENVFSVNAAALLRRVERVGYAAPLPSVNTRSSVAGIQMVGNRVFALDGVRMACDTDSSFSFPRPFIARMDALSLLRLFGDQEVMIALGERRGQISDGVTTVGFRLLGNDFFHVESAVPSAYKEKITLSPKDMLRELKYLKEFTANVLRPDVRFQAGALLMPTGSGKYKTCVEITGKNEIAFAFRLCNMMDAMRQFQDEPLVTVKITSAVSPIVIEAEGRSDFALVCPVRIRDKLSAA